jgi:hypothetical protein
MGIRFRYAQFLKRLSKSAALGGGDRVGNAQVNPLIDARGAEKGHLRTETS